MATLITYLIQRGWREKAEGSSTRSLLTSFHVGRIIYTDIRSAKGLRPVESLFGVFQYAVSQLAEFTIQEMLAPKERQYRSPAFLYLAAGPF